MYCIYLSLDVSGYSFKFSYSVMTALEMDVVYKSTDLYKIDQQLCMQESTAKSEHKLKVYFVRLECFFLNF